jgi:hypothetical protein
MMKSKFLYIGLVLVLASCVSKRKYTALQKQQEQSAAAKASVEIVLAKISVENDSLKRKIVSLDSLLIAERLKIGAVSPAAPAGEYAKTKTTLSKTVEYDTKALYIYNIQGYVVWPDINKADKFLIGIVGDSKLNASLGAQLYNRKIKQLPAVVEPYTPVSGKLYQMIFISENKQHEFAKIKKETANHPVLLIVENQNLEKVGAHIFIYAEGDKVKFRVNKKQIEKAGLSVSETLIKLSESTQ